MKTATVTYIEYDQKTLPQNGDKVEFVLHDDLRKKYKGEYIASEKMFYITSKYFYYAFEVCRWTKI